MEDKMASENQGDTMITTTKQEIRKAVMEALEGKREQNDRYFSQPIVFNSDFPSVADLVAETLGGEG
jgi:hypothetical protein